MLLHEIAHVALEHCFRFEDRNQKVFNRACDLVINSMLLDELRANPSQVNPTLDGGKILHQTPKGNEARLYSVEEVYEMLLISQNGEEKSEKQEACVFSDDHSLWSKGIVSKG